MATSRTSPAISPRNAGFRAAISAPSPPPTGRCASAAFRWASRRPNSAASRAARAALVTPLRDGMNLVAKEYVASQDPKDPGVLILSRFVGAAVELDAALLVNPYDSESVAAAIAQALSMPLDQRKARHEVL